MEAKRQNKRKLVIALALLAVIVVASVVTTVVLVLAASQQNVSSQIRVTYTAQEVAGTVTAAYMREEASDFTGMGEGATFVGGQATETANLAAEVTNVTLGQWYNTSTGEVVNTSGAAGTNQIDYVIFRYTFTNSANAAGRAYNATLTYTDNGEADTNISFYYWATADGTTLNQSTTTEVAGNTLKTTGTAVAGVQANPDAEPPVVEKNATTGWQTKDPATIAANGGIVSIDVPAGSAATTYVYLKVAITNTSNDAEFSGNFSWALTAIVA